MVERVRYLRSSNGQLSWGRRRSPRPQHVRVFNVFPGQPDKMIVGSELLQRFVIRIDFDRSQMALTDPAYFSGQGNGVEIPFHFQSNQPEVYGASMASLAASPLTQEITARCFYLRRSRNGSTCMTSIIPSFPKAAVLLGGAT